MEKGKYIRTEATKIKMSKARLNLKKKFGYINSVETRKKISKSNLGRKAWNKGIPCSKKTKKKLSKAHKGTKKPWVINIDKKGKIPINWKTLYTPKINQKRRDARLRQKLPTTDTSIELKVKDYLDKKKIKYIHPFNVGNKFQCDFYLPLANLIIECDGDYWHSREDMIKRDKSKDAYVKKCGFDILRLSESIINKGRFISHIERSI